MEKNVGVYIHIPFCSGKCAYCDFYSIVGKDKLMSEYHSAVLQHIKEYSPQLDGYLIDTVYFGGGTPSHFGATRLISIFNALKKYGNVLVDAEVTAEVNPESVTKEELVRLRRAGFNRLSIGVQSANDTMLKNLERRHSFADAETAFSSARAAGFQNISIDLIYGLPSQTKDDWADTLNRALAMKPDHVSCYGLKIEEGTPLYIFRDSPFVPDEDVQADMYMYAVETLSRFGLRQYEISNFARRGYESRHNLKYWLGDEYLGLGPSAHSYLGGVRFSHIEDVEKYTDSIFSGRSVIDQYEDISDFERAGEYLMLRLRTIYGISESEYKSIFRCGMDMVTELLENYRERGFAYQKDGRWILTTQGFMVSNVLIGEILDAHTTQRAHIARPWQNLEEEERDQISFFKSRRKVQIFNGE